MNINDLKEQALNLIKLIQKLEKKMMDTDKQINKLTSQGILDANPYWMKNKKGEPSYFCMYSSEKIKPKKTAQKIKYVGQNDAEIENILKAIERAKEVKKLEQGKNDISSIVEPLNQVLIEAFGYIEAALNRRAKE